MELIYMHNLVTVYIKISHNFKHTYKQTTLVNVKLTLQEYQKTTQETTWIWIRKIFYRHDPENASFSEKFPQVKNIYTSKETVDECFFKNRGRKIPEISLLTKCVYKIFQECLQPTFNVFLLSS